ncbi:MAG: membrane protein insertase YidC [Myxococcota bacterium]|nr:membrane protein insertase YidC [Myxococcota bacterium]
MILSIAAYFAWLIWFAPNQAPVQNGEMVNPNQDSVVGIEQTSSSDSVPGNVVEKPTVVDTTKSVRVNFHSKDFSDDEINSKISSRHGSVESLSLIQFPELPEKNPWWSWILSGEDESWSPYIEGEPSLNILTDKSGLVLAGVGKPSLDGNYNITATDNGLIASSQMGGLGIKKIYEKTDEPYVYNVDITFQNNTGLKQDLWIAVTDEMKEDPSRFYDALRPHAYVDGSVEWYTDVDSVKKNPDGTDQPPYWFGLGSRYFLVAVAEEVAPEKSQFNRVEARHFEEEIYGTVSYLANPLADGESRNIKLKMYIGPKELDRLRVMSNEWSQAVDFGIFGFFSRVLLWLLKIFYSGFSNWGLSIIFLTLLVKVIFFPMTQKAFESGKKMQLIQPLLNEVKEKYKDDQMLQSQETMKLFKKHGVSPLGGCLPTLIQMPIWFALYSALLYSVELYNSSFLYLEDLTSPDPYGILPVAYGILMFLSQKIMRPANVENMGEQQAMMMKMMKFMTIMFTFFMFTFPSGLVIYFCCNMLLTSIQQLLIRKKLEQKSFVPASDMG